MINSTKDFIEKPIISIPAGEPDDDNRDYLPGKIKNSKVVVNENGNNSHVYPDKLKEFHKIFCDDVEDTWYEYVPDSYDPSKKTPLVVALHGGLMTGWGQCIYTSWSMVADREGFIVVFPDASFRGLWLVEHPQEIREKVCNPELAEFTFNDFPDDYRQNHDINKIFSIIDEVKGKYNIDDGRIYMQGMSCGNAMTNTISRHYAYKFAAFAGSAGHVSPKILFDKDGNIMNDGGYADIWQTRMENDINAPGEDCPLEYTFRKNREYWNGLGECKDAPVISIDGVNNLAFYTGGKANLTYREVVNRDHGQTLDDAEMAWDYVFSGVRRLEDGSLEHTATACSRQGDKNALAVAPGKKNVLFDNKKTDIGGETFIWNKIKYHGLNGDYIVRDSYVMVPARALANIFGAEYCQNSGESEMTLKDGRKIRFSRGIISCTIDNRIRDMYVEAVERDGELYISAEWLCEDVLNMHVCTSDGVLYASDHNGKLSKHFAKLISDLL